MSNNLQLSEQRQHILLSCFETLSVGPVWGSNPWPSAGHSSALQPDGSLDFLIFMCLACLACLARCLAHLAASHFVRTLVLPPTLCNLTWIVTHKIATKICIPQQDLADDFDDDALKKFLRDWLALFSWGLHHIFFDCPAPLEINFSNTKPNLISVDFCLVRGGVGAQLLRYWHWPHTCN